MNRSSVVLVIFLVSVLGSGCAGARKHRNTIAEQQTRIQGLEEENERLRQEVVDLKARADELETKLEDRPVLRAPSDMVREMERLQEIIEQEVTEPGMKPGFHLEREPDLERDRSDLKEKMQLDTEKLRRKLEEKAEETSEE